MSKKIKFFDGPATGEGQRKLEEQVNAFLRGKKKAEVSAWEIESFVTVMVGYEDGSDA